MKIYEKDNRIRSDWQAGFTRRASAGRGISRQFPLAAAEGAGIQDGTYSHTMNGHNGEVTVTLTIEDGQIIDAQQESIETQGIGTVAWEIVDDTLRSTSSPSKQPRRLPHIAKAGMSS